MFKKGQSVKFLAASGNWIKFPVLESNSTHTTVDFYGLKYTIENEELFLDEDRLIPFHKMMENLEKRVLR